MGFILKRLRFYVFTFCLFSGYLSIAQQHIFKHFTVEDGLPTSEIYKVKQARDGRIILVSDRGVVIYDGYSFKTFSLQEGITNNIVVDFYEDKNGRFWFRAHGGTFFYIDDDTVVKVPLSEKDRGAFYNESSGDSFFADEQGVNWAETTHFKQRIFRINADFSLDKNVVDGSLLQFQLKYFSYSQALIFRNLDAKFKSIELRNGKVYDLQAVPEDFFNRGLTYLESDDAFYIASIKGVRSSNNTIIRVDKNNSRLTKQTFSESINTVYLDRAGNLWVSQLSGGAKKYGNGEIDKIPEKYLPGESITSVFEDHQGGIWFSSHNNGIFYKPWHELYQIEEPSLPCYSLTTFEGEMYVGYDYLLKPLDIEELSVTLKRLVDITEKEQTYSSILCVPSRSGKIFIKVNQIIRAEAEGSYCKIYCEKGVIHTLSNNLKSLERLLDPRFFFRCHNSHIISIGKVKEVITEGSYALMEDGSEVCISLRKRAEFFDAVKCFVEA